MCNKYGCSEYFYPNFGLENQGTEKVAWKYTKGGRQTWNLGSELPRHMFCK